jgi:nucleoside-diphosphate-sugar epimerase
LAELPRILVTGAGGFIGGRVVEVLHGLGLARVRAGVRRWSSAARIGRFPVEIVRCDVTDPTQVRESVEGVDAIVHCATGPRPVIVDGTANLLAAASGRDLRRFVHLSTVDVYGKTEGQLDEEQPLRRDAGDYGSAKIDAERACAEHARRGLPITVLRPSIVYGPFSPLWTIEFAERLQRRPWPFPPAVCGGTCNLLYVDDLVGAILLALDRDQAAGGVFNVNGAERPTWNEYFQALNRAMGLSEIESQPVARARLSAAAMRPVRWAARTAMSRFEAQLMSLYKSSGLAKRLMRGAEAVIRRAPTNAEFDLYGREVCFPTDKARRVLGYEPRFPMEDGIRLSVGWLRHHGFVTSPPAAPE